MRRMRLTADLGEHEIAHEDFGSPVDVDAQIIPIVDMASIACGAHAGNPDVMAHAVSLAQANGASIGAHPGYPDRENFGRVSMNFSADELSVLVSDQVKLLQSICVQQGAELSYIKPHGALYNDSIRDVNIQMVLLDVAEAFSLPLVTLAGAANSAFQSLAEQRGVSVFREAFADRRYTESGELMSRKLSGAVLNSTAEVLAQAEQLMTTGHVTVASGNLLEMPSDCICVHGDNQESIAMAKALSERLDQLSGAAHD